MNSYDFFVEYKTGNNRKIFRETKKIYKSLVKLKCGYVINKDRELNNHKEFIQRNQKTYSIGNIDQIKQISGVFNKSELNKLQSYIQKLPKYSFAIWFKFKLAAPYFSKDDDEFYIIQNPCLKEKVFKVPMVRGSGWKGVIAKAFRKLINENDNKKELIQSYLRIFGTGSNEFRELEGMIDNFVNKGKTLSFDKLISYLLFELGLKLTKDDICKLKNETEISNWLKNNILENGLDKNSKNSIPAYLQTHKGRVIFYPTYFDKLSLEIINPHDRRKRAGTNPIHYEVVPKETEGIFQLIYIPFDGILKKDDKIKGEVEEDLNNLCEALEKLSNNGIGAKTKLGWGRFEITDKKVFMNVARKDPKGVKDADRY